MAGRIAKENTKNVTTLSGLSLDIVTQIICMYSFFQSIYKDLFNQ